MLLKTESLKQRESDNSCHLLSAYYFIGEHEMYAKSLILTGIS